MGADSLYDVVIFSPHPDDAEMTIAGTIIRLVRGGRRVLNVALTHGEKGTFGDAETREKEFAAANAIMGTDCRILDFADTEVVNSPAGRLRIARRDPGAPAADSFWRPITRTGSTTTTARRTPITGRRGSSCETD